MKLANPVYSPSWSFSSAYDWGFTNDQLTSNLTTALTSAYKIAVLPVMCNEPTDFSYNIKAEQIDLSQFDLVLLSDIEFRSINQIREWIEKNNIQKYLLAVGGLCLNEQLESNIIYRPWWAFNLLRFNKFQTTYHTNKPFQFDALLGARRPHRDYVMISFQKNNMLDSSIVTYRDIFKGHQVSDFCQQFETEAGVNLNYPYVSPNLKTEWEVADKLTHSISPVVPWKIYKNTNYTILCETLADGNTFFLSEKPTKSLYAKRIFVPFSTPNYLKNMQALGFETFSEIFDESFDSIINPIARWKSAFDQVLYLNNQNADILYAKVAPRLEHNHNLLVNMPARIHAQMFEMLKKTVPEQYWIN